MDKEQIARVLDEAAVLLELAGENTFKVRAYGKAARAIELLSEDLGALISEGKLVGIPGIGKNIAAHIEEIAATGSFGELNELRAKVPEGVISMLAIPGLGPKRVRFIWKERSIKTIGELEMACVRHLLAEAPGFGEKTEAKILAGIESLKKFAGKRLLAEALRISERVVAEARGWPETIRAEACGSVRRRREIVADIDLLVSSNDPEKAMSRFVSLSSVERVVQRGKTKSEVILSSGIQCDLRVVSEGQFPFAEHHFTGSKEHNVAMRALAKKSGLKMNEYGLFRGDSEVSLECRDEAALFSRLGLSYIEPELRENMGEIEAASEGRLPRLVEEGDLRGVIHVHSTYTDGRASISEMAAAARGMGYSWIAVTDHSQAVSVAGGMKPQDLERQMDEIDALNEKLEGFRIFKGVEVDIMQDGSLDFEGDLLDRLDIVIAAVHSRFNMNEKEMTKRVVTAVSNPSVDVLAHPTGRLLLAREPYAIDMAAVIEASAVNGTAIEINAHPQRLDLDWRWCKAARDAGVKIAISPDAHSPEALRDAAYGVWMARKGWLEKKDVINCLGAEELLKALSKRPR